jgi:hypothetical protein
MPWITTVRLPNFDTIFVKHFFSRNVFFSLEILLRKPHLKIVEHMSKVGGYAMQKSFYFYMAWPPFFLNTMVSK